MYSNKQVFPPTVPTQKLEGRYWIRNYTYCINKGFDSEKKSFWMIFKAKFTWLKFPEFNPPFNLYQYLWYQSSIDGIKNDQFSTRQLPCVSFGPSIYMYKETTLYNRLLYLKTKFMSYFLYYLLIPSQFSRLCLNQRLSKSEDKIRILIENPSFACNI